MYINLKLIFNLRRLARIDLHRISEFIKYFLAIDFRCLVKREERKRREEY